MKPFLLSTLDPNAAPLARQYGLGLELSEFCTAWNLDERFDEVAPQLEAALRLAPARVLHGPFNELFPCAIDPQARALAARRYAQSIAMARRYGAEKVVIHGGYHPYIYYPEWYVEQSVVFWREFLPQIPQGVTVCVENVLETEPAWLVRIVREVADARLRLCLDIGHVHAYSPLPVERWLDAGEGLISHFHIHNNDGSRDSHSALPDGTMPMRALLAGILRRFPSATLTLELCDAAPSLRWLAEQTDSEGTPWI